VSKTTKAPAKPPPQEQREPLFPIPLPVIGVSGEFASGKTLFLLTIDPGPRTRVYDLEKSSQTYQSLGFDRVDVYRELLKAHPNGYRSSALWEWWRDDVLGIEPGRFTVIAIDTVTPIEDSLGDWVIENAAKFNATRKQFFTSAGTPSGLFWGVVKSVWERTLNDLAARCECFAFAAHMSTVYANNQPTMKRKAKGKLTLTQLASLYLEMDRKPDARGARPAVPSARVVKDRVVHTRIDPETGKVQIVPVLPPRLPEATPDAVRAYMLRPADFADLKPEELAPEEHLTDDDRAELRARTAEAQAVAAQATSRPSGCVWSGGRGRSTRGRETRRPGMVRPRRPLRRPAPADAREDPPPGEPRRRQAPPRGRRPAAMGFLASAEQVARLVELRDELFGLQGTEEAARVLAWNAVMERRGVRVASELTPDQADALITTLEGAVAAEREEGGPGEGPEGG
jgi:hypothetical protein